MREGAGSNPTLRMFLICHKQNLLIYIVLNYNRNVQLAELVQNAPVFRENRGSNPIPSKYLCFLLFFLLRFFFLFFP
jgi:hypothetical protein